MVPTGPTKHLLARIRRTSARPLSLPLLSSRTQSPHRRSASRNRMKTNANEQIKAVRRKSIKHASIECNFNELCLRGMHPPLHGNILDAGLPARQPVCNGIRHVYDHNLSESIKVNFCFSPAKKKLVVVPRSSSQLSTSRTFSPHWIYSNNAINGHLNAVLVVHAALLHFCTGKSPNHDNMQTRTQFHSTVARAHMFALPLSPGAASLSFASACRNTARKNIFTSLLRCFSFASFDL